jgi:hypothetical protein
MAMANVADDFKAFRANYLIPAATVSDISYRYTRITTQLNIDFWKTDSDTAHSLYVGSYGRDSAAVGISDLDVSFQLPNDIYHQYNAYQSNGQSALLQTVRASIQKTYANSYVGGDGQVVCLNFTDGIRFEILPVFLNNANTFTFPDSNGGGTWKTCDPRSEMSAFTARNTLTNGNLKALCRMMRVWKKYHNVPISGMLIDTLAYNFIDTWGHKDKSFLYHDYLARDFFEHMSNTTPNQAYWRAPGSGSYVYSQGNFRTQAAASHADALRAIQYGTNGNDWSYRQTWRAIFGPTFP